MKPACGKPVIAVRPGATCIRPDGHRGGCGPDIYARHLAEHPDSLTPAALLTELARALRRQELLEQDLRTLTGQNEAYAQQLRADDTSPVAQVNRLLGLSLWDVRSFRADVRIDFDEHGRILQAQLLNEQQD
jgi:hypothetical protein